jgi:aquaporin Z
MMKKTLMELLGTFFFVLTIIMTGNPFAIAAMLMAWVYIAGYVSGAHFNPMVTLAVALRSRSTSIHIAWYMAAQTIGVFLACAAAMFLGSEIVIPAPAVPLAQAFFVEALLAFVLAFVVLVVATSDKFKTSHVFGFAIGFTIPALIALGATTSGGLFNPAIALGVNIFGLLNGTTIVWQDLGMYLAGAFAGGALAAVAFNFFFEEK